MKERPILFSAPMVRAILDGRKTQTRRAINLDKAYHDFPHEILEWRLQFGRWFGLYEYNTVASCKCPYGEPGDRLWVRETWAVVPNVSDNGLKHKTKGDGTGATWRADWDGNPSGFTWKPSIHMPRWASRITLEITDVRVERLQDISNEDAAAEGMPSMLSDEYCEAMHTSDMLYTHRAGFKDYLKNHGHMDWDANPWVWVIQFEVVQ